jgi:uncharacterized glyoxalase superfamily protein PhnB
MTLTGLTPILNVSDVAASLLWFEKLGWKRCWTYNDGGPIESAAGQNEHGPANFAAVGSGEAEIFLCRHGQGSRGGPYPRHLGDEDTGGVWMSWWLKEPREVDAVHATAVEQGVFVSWPPTDEPWGVRECRIVHPDGHTFRVGAPLTD